MPALRLCPLLSAALLFAILSGCGPRSRSQPGAGQGRNNPATARPNAASALFTDITESAGVRFKLDTGIGAGRYRFIESTPSGCALFDYDNDGFLDLFLVQSGPSDPLTQRRNEWREAPSTSQRDAKPVPSAGSGQTLSAAEGTQTNDPQSASPSYPPVYGGTKGGRNPQSTERPHCALYHNNGDGTFTDVTPSSGLDRDLGYGHAAVAADYDNDGFEDLFITAYGGNHLFHNECGRMGVREYERKEHPPPHTPIRPHSALFRDVTAQMGLGKVHSTGYATSAAFGDYDNDGWLDLYVCYYCPWTWENNIPCKDVNGRPDYCSPQLYDPDIHQLYHNEGGRRFVDVTQKAGINKARGRGLAVAWLDYDGDGWQDVFVANDLMPNFLWHNNRNGTFSEVALYKGCAFTEDGRAMAAMGIGVADYDRSGRPSLFVTNFSAMPNALFKNLGNTFQDVSINSGVAAPHMPYLAFGCEFLDYDNDGWPDLLVADGHVQIHADAKYEGTTYKERKQLFRNQGNGTFAEITDTDQLGALNVPMVSRGLAVGDIDNDGRVDAVFMNQNDSVQILRNQIRNSNHWIAFKTIGVKSNRDGRHAKFLLTAGGGRQTSFARAGSSYLSTSDRRVYFGLGSAAKVDSVEIRWPSGTRQALKNLPADTIYVVTEEKGITGRIRTAGGGRP